MTEKNLWNLEEQFWTNGASFYDIHLTPAVMMIFPEPVGIMERSKIMEVIDAAPRWKNVSISHKHLVHPNSDTAVLAYYVQADRGGSEAAYNALCSFTYVKTEDRWQLALHQQTPYK